MTNIKLTAKETEMLIAFINEGRDCTGSLTPEQLKDDNMTCMSSADLVSTLGWKQRSVQGVMASLEKKGMISNSGESARGAKDPDWFATDEGIDRVWMQALAADDVAPEVSEADMEAVKAARQERMGYEADATDEYVPEPEKHTNFASHYNVLRVMKDGKQMSRCQAIRWVALSWGGTRKEFIAQGEQYGIHKGTLGTQWAKAHREGK